MKNTIYLLTILAAAVLLAPTVRAQVSAPTGLTTNDASQLAGYFNDDDDLDTTLIQVTNTSNTSSVTLHIQFWGSEDSSGDPVTDPCIEVNFTDTLTPNDTHTYIVDDLYPNDDLCLSSGVGCTNIVDLGVAGLDAGFFTITPVISDSDRRAIAFNHLFGVVDYSISPLAKVNAMGRLAVSFITGDPLPDGTILDGVTGGYVLLRPDVLRFNFHDDSPDEGTDIDEAFIINIMFTDEYSGPFGDYRSQPTSATFDTLLFDEFEVPTSCQTVTPTCILDRGINSEFDQGNDDIDDPAGEICTGNTVEVGTVRYAVTGLEALSSTIGLTIFHSSSGNLGLDASWMVAEGDEVFPTPTPTPTPTATPTPTDTPTPSPTNGGGGGGGSGCAIAGPVQTGTALANMLMVLLPGAVFALRRRFGG